MDTCPPWSHFHPKFFPVDVHKKDFEKSRCEAGGGGGVDSLKNFQNVLFRKTQNFRCIMPKSRFLGSYAPDPLSYDFPIFFQKWLNLVIFSRFCVKMGFWGHTHLIRSHMIFQKFSKKVKNRPFFEKRGRAVWPKNVLNFWNYHQQTIVVSHFWAYMGSHKPKRVPS